MNKMDILHDVVKIVDNNNVSLFEISSDSSGMLIALKESHQKLPSEPVRSIKPVKESNPKEGIMKQWVADENSNIIEIPV